MGQARFFFRSVKWNRWNIGQKSRFWTEQEVRKDREGEGAGRERGDPILAVSPSLSWVSVSLTSVSAGLTSVSVESQLEVSVVATESQLSHLSHHFLFLVRLVSGKTAKFSRGGAEGPGLESQMTEAHAGFRRCPRF